MSLFPRANNINISGGNFTAVSNPAANIGHQNDIVAFLYSHSAPAGLLDAKERFDAPKCDEGTRVSMIRGMKTFVQEGDAASSPSLYWLHGPAGVGKSALAQSVSLQLQTEGDHAASFFFSRTSSGRGDGNQLIMTLAYQLAMNFPALRPFMSKVVKKHPGIINSSNTVQMQSLIVNPINKWHKKYTRSIQRWADRIMNTKPHPRLILVDGLDECNDSKVQTDLISCIASAVRQLSIPLRFVVISRPESHILAAFELDALDGVAVTKKNLGEDENSDEQITTFLLKEFAEIRRTHPIRHFLPERWPRPDQIGQLVAKSSKGFIYATTVIRYIKMPQNRPDLCLDRILGMSELPTSDKPYEPLDILYRYIFESVPEANKRSVHDIFHLLVLPDLYRGMTRDPTTIEQLFNYPPGHVQHVLHDLLCLVELRVTHERSIEVLHASLPDFLLDESRSGPLCIDNGDARATHAACYLMRIYCEKVALFTSLERMLYYLQKSNMSNDLLNEQISKTNLVRQYKTILKIALSEVEDMSSTTAYLIILLKSSRQQIYIRNQIGSLKDYIFTEYPPLHSLLPEFILFLTPRFRDWKVRKYSGDVCRIFEWKFDSSQNELREAIFETFFLMMALWYRKRVPVSYPQPRLTPDGLHYWADIVYPPDGTDGPAGSLSDASSS